MENQQRLPRRPGWQFSLWAALATITFLCALLALITYIGMFALIAAGPGWYFLLFATPDEHRRPVEPILHILVIGTMLIGFAACWP